MGCDGREDDDSSFHEQARFVAAVMAGWFAIMRCVIPRGSGNFLAKIPYYIMRVNCISILIAIFI
jgi:hypothetical protein